MHPGGSFQIALAGQAKRVCPVKQGISRRAAPARRPALSVLRATADGDKLEELLNEGAARGTVLAVGSAMSLTASEPCPTSQASGEWELYAGDGASAKLEGARIVIDWEKGIVQTVQGLTSRVLKILGTNGSELAVVEVSKRVMSVVSLDDPETAPTITMRVVYHTVGKVLVLKGELEGRTFMAILKSKNTAKRIKPWDLPGYYEGFMTDDRMKQEGDNAALLDNVTPNIKLGVSVTIALTAAVAAFIVANPPPSKDQPLPTRSVAVQAAPPADTIQRRADARLSLGEV
eukprot:CAMPEP_0206245556 /NCGR_PEP_ID=MMETSP0047_2-20121206/18760_1 /ASSEMBLY_ACC=CAM_ASM_000192 /TAXON_ID=195065 /ORGANISM="Chroomonas mesostigmatica_cf, Strain CCMP1168" /LENGTH=288 /DNA_ID=CAMNT_0053670863 /DNA_START=160 /DNA_END=1026 /DNA_ORIENTATION=-